MRRFTLAVLLVTGVFGCRETEPEQLLRATEVTDQNDLIGGPLAHGQIGDFLIENDKVRYIITGAHHSWGPGLFGGTVVDADRRRAEPFYRGSRATITSLSSFRQSTSSCRIRPSRRSGWPTTAPTAQPRLSRWKAPA